MCYFKNNNYIKNRTLNIIIIACKISPNADKRLYADPSLDQQIRNQTLISIISIAQSHPNSEPYIRIRIHILCCITPCNAVRESLDFLVIRVSTDLKVIQRFTCCTARYRAAEEHDSSGYGQLIALSFSIFSSKK
jgi:hypothetical protein